MGQWLGSCQITKYWINLDLIEIIQFCLKIYDMWRHPTYGCVDGWFMMGQHGGDRVNVGTTWGPQRWYIDHEGTMETTWGRWRQCGYNGDNVGTRWGQHGDHRDDIGTTGGPWRWCGDDMGMMGTMWWQHGDNNGTRDDIEMGDHRDDMGTRGDNVGQQRWHGDHEGTVEMMWRQCGDNMETMWWPWGPQISKNAIKFERIKIIQFCLKIYDLWRHPHLWVAVWVVGLMDGVRSNH